MPALDSQQLQPLDFADGSKGVGALLTFSAAAVISIDMTMLQQLRKIGVFRSFFFSSKSVAGTELLIAAVTPVLQEFRFLPKKQGFVSLPYVTPPNFTVQSTGAGGGTATIIFYERDYGLLIWDTI